MGWIWVLVASVPDICILFTCNDRRSNGMRAYMWNRQIYNLNGKTLLFEYLIKKRYIFGVLICEIFKKGHYVHPELTIV